MSRSPLDDARLSTLSESVGLDLSPERRAVLLPALEGLLQQFDVLYEVNVDETEAWGPRLGVWSCVVPSLSGFVVQT